MLTNITINRSYFIGSTSQLRSIPTYVREENLGSTRKFVENYFLFLCITNRICALKRLACAGRTFLRQRKKVPPAHTQRVYVYPLLCRHRTGNMDKSMAPVRHGTVETNGQRMSQRRIVTIVLQLIFAVRPLGWFALMTSAPLVRPMDICSPGV
jgi:hypothetical protein